MVSSDKIFGPFPDLVSICTIFVFVPSYGSLDRGGGEIMGITIRIIQRGRFGAIVNYEEQQEVKTREVDRDGCKCGYETRPLGGFTKRGEKRRMSAEGG